ncbi:MAG TPA: LeuA family protein [Polyangiaceae bacterium]|nr:LeuA family protein [Polyangiaceae bacterium]
MRPPPPANVKPNSPDLGESWFDWNAIAPPPHAPGVVDETLRDGLQSPSAQDPPLDKKLELLSRAARLEIEGFALGFPASRPRQFEDALCLAKEIARQRLTIQACCAARTLSGDIAPIANIAQRSGLRVQVGLFIGASPLRQHAEGWSVEQLLRLTDDAVTFAVREGLEVLYVVEDSTRSTPETLSQLYSAGIRCGATRLCVADTVGHATPEGAAKIVHFVCELAASLDPRVRVEWHGHRDRGLDVANCLAAWAAGAERCHGTALGIGERAGNAPIEQLLVNLSLLGWRQQSLAGLPEYVQTAAEALGFSVPPHQPVVGEDAFRTATGAHAAAVSKALTLGNAWLADRVFSSVPAALVGRQQHLDVGPGSGEANVVAWLGEHGIVADAKTVATVLSAAKRGSAVLSPSDILALLAGPRSEAADAPQTRPLSEPPRAGTTSSGRARLR